MIASQVDGRRRRKGLSCIKPSVLGLDGRSLADLRSLPDTLPGSLADLLREVERLGKWPARLAWPRVTMPSSPRRARRAL